MCVAVSFQMEWDASRDQMHAQLQQMAAKTIYIKTIE